MRRDYEVRAAARVTTATETSVHTFGRRVLCRGRCRSLCWLRSCRCCADSRRRFAVGLLHRRRRRALRVLPVLQQLHLPSVLLIDVSRDGAKHEQCRQLIERMQDNPVGTVTEDYRCFRAEHRGSAQALKSVVPTRITSESRKSMPCLAASAAVGDTGAFANRSTSFSNVALYSCAARDVYCNTHNGSRPRSVHHSLVTAAATLHVSKAKPWQRS